MDTIEYNIEEPVKKTTAFRKSDWLSFGTAGLLTLALYTLTLAPTVTLEDSGELAVASDYLGVPHPPGYPIWTLLTWLFQLLFHWVEYNGHPNPAWGVGFASAVAGAGACALLALLISHSGRALLRGWKGGIGIGEKASAWISGVAGVAGGLLLACSPVMWSQSVIVEVYSLNALFQMAVILLLYLWMRDPEKTPYLFWAAFLFGLGLTNHQTLLFLILALVVAILMKDPKLFRDFVVGALLVAPAFLLAMKGLGWFWSSSGENNTVDMVAQVLSQQLSTPQKPVAVTGIPDLWKWSRGPADPAFWVYNYCFLAVPVALWTGWKTRNRPWSVRLAWGLAASVAVYLAMAWCSDYFISQPEPKPAEFMETWSPWPGVAVTRPGDAAFNTLDPFTKAVWDGIQAFPARIFDPATGTTRGFLFSQKPAGPLFAALCWLAMLLPLLGSMLRLDKGRTVAITMLLAELGVAFYLYLPLASDQNPPMNWGYARTWEGFMHAVTRGQYEAIVATDVFSQKFVEQLGSYLSDLRGQFTLPITALGFLPFCAWGLTLRRRRLSMLPVALGLLLASMPLFVLEACGVPVLETYRWPVALILMLAGAGFLLMLVRWVARTARDWLTWDLGVKIVTAGFALALLAGVVWVDWNSLAAVFPSADALAEAVKNGHEVVFNDAGQAVGFLKADGKAFFLALVFLPPLLAAGAWFLMRSPLQVRMELHDEEQRWVLTSLVGFFAVSVVFLIFQNPALDLQTLFIGRVQFIQSHAFYAMWLGYGVLLSIACLERFLGPRLRLPALAAAACLPLALLWQNAWDDEQIRIVGGAEQNGHSYGWQFGNWGLEGVKGIRDDFVHWFGGEDSEEFKAQWGAFCEAMGSDDPQYPPPMTQGAIFYGGTDPGRFVPTYMIYSADVRSDVYLITQNALADGTFMNITRDLYGDTIYIPSPDESDAAFRRYIDDVEAGRIPPSADISFENGRVSVQGVGGVMAINGILAKLIFEENKDKHDFYVEESYAIQWMYPYLQPNGLMLKLNAEPMAGLPGDVVENDLRFWKWYVPWLLGQSTFTRDICARKAFSKLRSAIAGIYEWRRMWPEAEEAYRQAIDLYPLSPEAIFRLAQMRVNLGQSREAEALLADFCDEDPHNQSATDFLRRIRALIADRDRFERLLSRHAAGEELTVAERCDFFSLALRGGSAGVAYTIALGLLDEPGTPSATLLDMASLFYANRQTDLSARAMEKYLLREPGDVKVWHDLAAIRVAIGQYPQAFDALKRMVGLGGMKAFGDILRDPRLQPLENHPPFREWFNKNYAEFIRQTRGPAPASSAGNLLQMPVGANLPGLR